MRDRLTRLRKEIEDLEREEELVDLRQQQEAARARLAEQVRQFDVFAVAAALMNRIQRIYDLKRQPWRIQRAAKFFARFTRDEFEGIRMDETDGGVVAVRKQGKPLAPDQLSRGTREQLYLALRLALVDELAEKRGIVFPLVFDDILVNFDDSRTRATAETLVEAGRERQVFFFTAHRLTVELLRNAGAQRTVDLSSVRTDQAS
jgi:uncharacterized protein YhaN